MAILKERVIYPNPMSISAIKPRNICDIKKVNPAELSIILLYLEVFFNIFRVRNNFDAAPYRIYLFALCPDVHIRCDLCSARWEQLPGALHLHQAKAARPVRRQAGIIAAPGIVALTKMVDRLAEDHENAKLLEKGLGQIKGMRILNPVKTNMVYIDVSGLGWTGADWMEACAKLGWKSRGRSTTIRLCTHYGIEREDIKAFIDGITKLAPTN